MKDSNGQKLAISIMRPGDHQAAQQRRGAADCGEYRQAAGAFAQDLMLDCRGRKMDLVHLKVSEGCHAAYS